ncbi:MAG TPA: ABC transporter permease [Chloroflexia bacterium]|nr:ABC transporter permease [Chloroflexia bacterium]
MWSRIANIWKKEITENVRDKKALRQGLLIPVIIGIFYALFSPLLNSAITERAKEPVVIPAQGIENADPRFIAALEQFDITLQPFEGDLAAVIRSGEKNAGVIIPPGFSEALNSERPAALTLLTNRTSGGIFGGGFSGDRLNLAVSRFNQTVVTGRVETRNIDPVILSPINLETQDLTRPEQLAGAFAAFTLPILLAVVVVQGGFFIAVDVTAGEKERGTLESLLVTPASDLEVFLGKLGAVFTMTTIPTVLTFMAFWIASQFMPSTVTNGGVLPFSVVGTAILLSIPLALFLNTALMTLSIRTKTFKDAQQAATPVIFAAMVPSMAAAFVQPTNPVMFLIPIYGPSSLVGALAVGTPIPGMAYVYAVVGSLLAAAICIPIALRVFNRERLLYGV